MIGSGKRKSIHGISARTPNTRYPGKESELITFIAKYSVLTSIVVLIMAQLYNNHMDRFVSYLISPIFSVDLDLNGEPDLEQIRRFQIKLFGGKFKFPVGLIIYNFIELFIKLVLLFFILKMVLKYFMKDI